jgi:two-component sensor histidine kinase
MSEERELERENQELKETIYSAYETIEAAITLTDFQDTLTSEIPILRIFETSGDRLQKILPFHAAAFFLLNDETGALELKHCRPAGEWKHLEKLIADEVEGGNVHIALRDQRPMLRHPGEDDHERLLLHSISTSRRSRGLFAGLYHPGEQQSDRLALLMLTLILSHCANALESAALYGLLQHSNRELSGSSEHRRMMLEEMTREFDRVLTLIQSLMRIDESGFREECATRLTVLRGVYRTLTVPDGPRESRAADLLTILTRHYSTVFALPEESVQLTLSPEGLSLKLREGIPLALALYELLALIYHRSGSPEPVRTLLRVERLKDKLLLTAEGPAERLPDPGSRAAAVLTYLVRDELMGHLKLTKHPMEGRLELQIPLRD